jgi:hypothetical protein
MALHWPAAALAFLRGDLREGDAFAPKEGSFKSPTGQIDWQGKVGVVQVEAPRYQAYVGFLKHRKFDNAYWSVETLNHFAAISVVSLTKTNIAASDRVLITGVARMENTGRVANEALTKLLEPGTSPILVEPLSAKFTIHRREMDPQLKIRALDANGQPLKTKVPFKWAKTHLSFSWIPKAIYLEIYQ